MCKELAYKRQNNAETAINARAKLECLAAWRNPSRNGAQSVIAYDAASVLHRIKKVYCERVIPLCLPRRLRVEAAQNNRIYRSVISARPIIIHHTKQQLEQPPSRRVCKHLVAANIKPTPPIAS